MAEPCTSVLVIDDERPLAAIVASYLSKAGFDPAVAYTGPDGVRSARHTAHSRPPRTSSGVCGWKRKAAS